MNPILSREIRARFRDRRSFLLLFVLITLLCVAAAWIYGNATNFGDVPVYATGYGGGYGGNSVREVETRTGRDLFRFLALGNTFAWLLIAPALTATGLAQERERGLLESLWLSPFRVGAQVWGRLGAALCFLAVLQVAALPVYGIAVLLGGVSPFDIGISGLLIGLTALCGASLGLFCSARSYRSSNALGAAFLGVTLWSALAGYGAYQMLWAATSANFFLTFNHPVAVLALILSPNDFAPRFGGPVAVSTSDAMRFGLGFQVALSLLLLFLAIRKASKPLPDMKWSEGNVRLKKWRDALEIAKTERAERLEAARARDAVAGALLYEVPVEKFVRFKDPLLTREVRGRFRLRQSGLAIAVLRFCTLIIAVAFWLSIAYNIFDPPSRSGAGFYLMFGLWGFGTLAIGVMSAGAFVREREAGTWEGLHLSLLSPREIARAKWLSPLVTLAYWSTPFWILLPFLVSSNFDSLGALLIVIASLCSVAAWGLWVSSRAPHSAAATSWTLISLLVALVVLPTLDNTLGIGSWVSSFFLPDALPNYSSGYASGYYGGEPSSGWRTFDALWNSYHPYLALENLSRGLRIDSGTKSLIVALNLGFNALLTGILLWLVWKRLRKTEF